MGTGHDPVAGGDEGSASQKNAGTVIPAVARRPTAAGYRTKDGWTVIDEYTMPVTLIRQDPSEQVAPDGQW